MRLHNRQVKAEFWTDPDLLRLPRDERTFYHGLWHCSEDSACLEDSPFTLKLLLFPSPVDADVTVEVLAGWIEDLIGMGKLVRYEAKGKQYLYLTNFHRHQTLRNPGASEVPLPRWIRWQESREENGKRVPGRYILVYDPLAHVENPDSESHQPGTMTAEERYQDGTDPVPDSNQPGTGPKVREGKVIEAKSREGTTSSATDPVPQGSSTAEPGKSMVDVVVVMDDVMKFWQQNLHPIITPYQVETLYDYVKQGMEPPVILEALRRSVGQNKRTLSYVEGILRRWQTDGVKTVEDIEVLDQSREFERRQRDSHNDQDRPPPKPIPLTSEQRRRSAELTEKIKALAEKMEVPQ